MGKHNLTFLAKKNGIFGFELLRSLTFLTQNLGLLALSDRTREPAKIQLKNLKQVLKDMAVLLEKDAGNIAGGLYPASVLRPEPPTQFFWRYPKILWDAMTISKRRSEQRSHDFNGEASQYFRDVPDYFRRNFHFQTGGYLTAQSAELYEHQVEILFSGAADAMRRLILPLMAQHFPQTKGEGLHFLEVAAGTGRLTRFVKLMFPKAKITVMDISYPYLKRAQENLSEFQKIDFLQGDAAHNPLKDQQFDAIYSCFLFHELPLEVRRQAVSESFRVLKPGGFFGLVDSVQKEDKTDFEWALQQFPVDFHEPFYKNYIQNPMEGLLMNQGFQQIKTEIGFFSKAVAGVRPLAPREKA